MKNRSAISGILQMRCPQCREGKMFPANTLYTTQFMKMNDRCACCEQPFTPEPGYYFGAMFVSYALNAAFFIIVWLGMYLLMDNITVTDMIIALLIVVLGLLPITFRLSRVLWIYIFVRYDERENYKHELNS
ncbi:DUF983 domain-containing protein [Pseudochryseolinea flava]|uniref:DUF983 domain-containing protein n=1 Tax=Pseudochryseolinea flava TaxID=2059302 RepID=A0A364Y8I1_9BACT|nr:DUF983 domain-containing protein [Pseudochryseolinea flava]RAW02160.1 DUF983 domain-containing protein [Pseudochryseolinea flava]